MNLHIVAIITFQENYLMDAVEMLQKLVRETRKEEGCITYDLVEDNEKKGTFFIVELWESVEHHKNHLGTEHFLDFRLQSSKIMEGENQIYKGFKIG